MLHKPTYEECIARITELERIFQALKNQEVDAIVGSKNVLLIRIREAEDNLSKQRADMEELLEELTIHQSELEAQAQELRQAQEEIRDARDRYRDLYDFAPLGYLTIAKNMRILDVNWTAAQMLGCRKNELINSYLSGLAIDPEDALYFHIKRVLETGREQKCDLLLRKRGGPNWHALLTSIPLDSGEKQRQVRIAITDISVHKKVEEMKDQFLSLVSHELRTPLTVIAGSLEVALHEQASPEEVRELIQSAAESTDMLANLLENMLELTRHQTGSLELMTEATDIGMLTSRVIDKLKGQGTKQKFEVGMPANLPLLTVDPLRVERILHNLLENAVKYSPEGSAISVTAQKDGIFLITSVKDRGTGISQKDQKDLFQMFSRFGKPAATSGTGLGLVVCQRLLEAHGGWIKVDSAPGQGSTFSFGLPLNSGS